MSETNIVMLQSTRYIPGVQCQELKGTDIELTGSMQRHNNNDT